MGRINVFKLWRICFLVVVLLFFGTVSGSADTIDSVDNKITINFQDVDITNVISSVSRITGRTFIVDPRVKGKVTIVAGQEIAEDELYPLFLSILQVHEFAAIEEGEVVKIVPLARVKHDSPVIDVGGQTAGNRLAESMVTQLFKLKYIPADKLVAILRPLVSSKSYLAAQVDSNILIVSDRSANISRLAKIIDQIDQPSSGEIELIKLEYADARDVVQIIEGLEGGPQKGVGAEGLRLISDSRTNSILFNGPDDKILKIKTLVSYLDTPIESEGATQVVFLRYANAKDLLPILQGGDFLNTGGQQAQKNPNTTGGPRQGELSVQADEATNALVITAPPAVVRNINLVIRKLDIRRPQVMIEAVIAEVKTGVGAEFGVQWRATDVTSEHEKGVIGGTSFNGTSGPNINVLSSGDNTAIQGSLGSMAGFNLGYLNGVSSILGAGLNLGALVSALASDSDTNILSTPSLVTMDNEEAEIVVGQNVSIPTGSYTSTGNNSTPQTPFTTYERQDVGIMLKVMPQINEGDTIRMEIEQEVSSSGPLVDGNRDLSTRRIKTSVMVDDGKILVLGGLISDDVQEVEQRVPLLGSIPLLGWLFRYNKTTHAKRNLMVFLRPTILRDSEANNRITFSKYDYMRRLQLGIRDEGIALLPNAQAPVLPENMQAE